MVTEIFIHVRNVRSFEKYTFGPNALTSTFLLILGCVWDEGNILAIIKGIHLLALGCVAVSAICTCRTSQAASLPSLWTLQVSRVGKGQKQNG